MNLRIVLPVAVTAVALAGALWGERRGILALRVVCKPLASAGFLAAAILWGATGTSYGWVILGALGLSALGDVLLIRRTMPALRAGLLSFLCAHLAFAGAFAWRGLHPVAIAGAAIAVAWAAAATHRGLKPHVPAPMRRPVTAYVIVISVMVTLAIGTVGRAPSLAIALGSVAFFLSDISVARDRFQKAGFNNRLWGLPMYYGAQLLFAWSARS